MLGSGDAGKGVVLKRMLMRLLGGLLRSTTGSTVSFLNEKCKTMYILCAGGDYCFWHGICYKALQSHTF